MPDPLPELSPADFSRRRIFHQVVNGNGTLPPEPGVEVLYPYAKVGPYTRLGDRSLRDAKEVRTCYIRVAIDLVNLIGALHVAVEDFLRNLNQAWMGDPSAVMPEQDLSLLVCPHLSKGEAVCFFVVLYGNVGRHASHGVSPSTVAGPDQQVRV